MELVSSLLDNSLLLSFAYHHHPAYPPDDEDDQLEEEQEEDEEELQNIQLAILFPHPATSLPAPFLICLPACIPPVIHSAALHRFVGFGGIDNLQKGIDWFPRVIRVILFESRKITRDAAAAAKEAGNTVKWN